MTHSEPQGVVFYDADTDRVHDHPPRCLVLTPNGWRELMLRVARGTIRNVPVHGPEREGDD